MQIRATNPEDKELRREAILDAAEQLWLSQPERMSSVADIATAAGLAKGTVYLYFRSKEELFLGIHERHVTTFFTRMRERAQSEQTMTLDEMFNVNRQFLLDFPAFLPLATLCHGLLERQIPLEAAFAFEERTYERLDEIVTALRQHFPQATQALMLQSYALFLGLWQLMRPSPLKDLMKERALMPVCTEDYLHMLEAALKSLWRGALAPEEKS
ncbi:MAG: TetR/AcrR family transcriptional regulator [Gammaproteobacteria bacterium]|nr:TetR/AcrR family transcriptional regulator [Gammaproteobacteria bacterium]MBU1725823.1 TetR/AcrR family transcriptional regulator [Gammaproteobacteria bacterium]MBU2007326.1 TetR/AcrR family transcriptional regulator [Gammaproteobacteria bacterium]